MPLKPAFEFARSVLFFALFFACCTSKLPAASDKTVLRPHILNEYLFISCCYCEADRMFRYYDDVTYTLTIELFMHYYYDISIRWREE